MRSRRISKKLRKLCIIIWIISIVFIITECTVIVSVINEEWMQIVFPLISVLINLLSAFLLSTILNALAELLENTYRTSVYAADTVDNTYDLYGQSNYYLSIICHHIDPSIPIISNADILSIGSNPATGAKAIPKGSPVQEYPSPQKNHSVMDQQAAEYANNAANEREKLIAVRTRIIDLLNSGKLDAVQQEQAKQRIAAIEQRISKLDSRN